jgi:hypothetical protein
MVAKCSENLELGKLLDARLSAAHTTVKKQPAKQAYKLHVV